MPAYSFPTSRKRNTCPLGARFTFSAGSPPPNRSLQRLPPPDATTRPQDATTRRGGWVGTKTRTRDNDEGGDGPSCPSSQNVRFFFVITLYIRANTHPLPPPAVPPLQPNTKNTPHRARFSCSAGSPPPTPSTLQPTWDAFSCLPTPLPSRNYQRAYLGTLMSHSSTKARRLGMLWSSNGWDIPNNRNAPFRAPLLFCQ